MFFYGLDVTHTLFEQKYLLMSPPEILLIFNYYSAEELFLF